MDEMDRKAKKELLTEIQTKLEAYTPEELEHIRHVLFAIDDSREGRLYYFARFSELSGMGKRAL
jgi:hypothetical protein